jgi:glyoxylase-like metal-dependent hydrolase (beta-lactamase superfamily II)
MVDFTYPPFTPDIAITGELDLAPYGIEGRAVLMPGHTAGSIVIELQSGEVFVGDMLLGGTMGGNLFPHAAGEHYFQADLEQSHRNIRTLIERGFKVFHLGHGGPVSDASIKRGFPALMR